MYILKMQNVQIQNTKCPHRLLTYLQQDTIIKSINVNIGH